MLLSIKACATALLNCSSWIDGDDSYDEWSCPTSPGQCFPMNVDLDLGSRYFVQRIRIQSDWWTKKPGSWELLASDDNVHYSKVMTASSNPAPWRCVHGEPCNAAVPAACCPGGQTQDTSQVGQFYGKYDDFSFTGVAARYLRLRIHSTFDSAYLGMRELELFGHACLGEVTCEAPTCGGGVCTNQDVATCSCKGCTPEATCNSAFTNAAPACTTP